MYKSPSCLLALLSFILLPSSIGAFRLDLGGQWTFCSSSSDHHCYNGSVPGDVFYDLYTAGAIPNPLFGDNSLSLNWISREQWTYSKTFCLSEKQLKMKDKFIVFEGLDTVATVRLNDQVILRSHNQFVRHVHRIESLLKMENRLEVEFQSPVVFAEQKAEKYKKRKGHELPPDCPPGVYRGECHPNFIRKAQYSFSWDWGPSIPTIGIWRPLYLLFIDEPTPLSLSWVTVKKGDFWNVSATVEYVISTGSSVNCQATIEGLASTSFAISGTGTNVLRKQYFTLNIPTAKARLWWPATEGPQVLYNFTVVCEKNQIVEEIGFREIELVQDLVYPEKPEIGRNFYIKVNDRPVFLKGSNWIPASMFSGEPLEERVEFLLDSAVEANMNTLRVWGGGVYESEFFYRLANRKGILLWQDMMFACALYPSDKKFLRSVAVEVEQQIFRLRKHPSVLLFAGNNENEVAIRTHWWNPLNYTEADQVKDYVTLYADTIAPIVKNLDSTRPFLLSSPSNGIKTEEEGGVAKNPGDPRYGDIHFYNEFINLWQDFSYMSPRCATEYGVQSMPFRRTMTHWINESDWRYMSYSLLHRQHHPGGVATNLLMVFNHFPISGGCSLDDVHRCAQEQKFIDRFAYYSQAHQAIVYKVQTEHYRRFRGRLTEDGKGNTMCALYWQLNDVWAAPTWSSIDFDLQWKMVHYEARRFFSPVIIALYTTPADDLAATVVNDGQKELKDVLLRVKQFGWGSQFLPVYETEINISVAAASINEVKIAEKTLMEYDSDYVISAQLTSADGSSLAPEAVLLPDRLYEAQLWLVGKVEVADFKRLNETTYGIRLEATDISPFTWISVETDYLGWFSDNGFTMVSPSHEVTLNLRKPTTIVREQVTVCNLKNCGTTPTNNINNK